MLCKLIVQNTTYWKTANLSDYYLTEIQFGSEFGIPNKFTLSGIANQPAQYSWSLSSFCLMPNQSFYADNLSTACLPTYDASLLQNGNLVTNSVNANSALQIVANTSDPLATQAKIIWFDQTDTPVRQITKQIVAGSANDTYSPTDPGAWKVQVHFLNAYGTELKMLEEPFDVSFYVLPESPVGTVVIAVTSLTVLGLFMMARRHNKTPP